MPLLSKKEALALKLSSIRNDSLYPLILTSIHAIEKARHRILLDMPISIGYEWAIREDGSSIWKEMRMTRTDMYYQEIELKVTHIRPCSYGYSVRYGFPHNEEYMREGFTDEFLLRDHVLQERFWGSPLGPVNEDYYDDRKYVAYWDRDPYGWSDRIIKSARRLIHSPN